MKQITAFRVVLNDVLGRQVFVVSSAVSWNSGDVSVICVCLCVSMYEFFLHSDTLTPHTVCCIDPLVVVFFAKKRGGDEARKERERETDRQTDKQTERLTERERERGRLTNRESERERGKHRQTDRELGKPGQCKYQTTEWTPSTWIGLLLHQQTLTQRQTDRDRQTEGGGGGGLDRDRQKDRGGRQREKIDRQTETDRQSEGGGG